MTVAVCLKWVVPAGNQRLAHLSLADEAALELALRAGAARGEEVRAVTAGGSLAEAALRAALAAGATEATRVDLADGAPSADVAAGLSTAVAGCTQVWCGDVSSDRGSGSVPAFLAAELGMAQALGLVAADPTKGSFSALRRLDGGRREELRIDGPAVLSVEGAAARLRRAALETLRGSQQATISVVPAPPSVRHLPPPTMHPFRPRPRVLPPPHGATALQRVREVTHVGAAAAARAEVVVLDPPAAARRILQALQDWGYIRD